MPRADPGIKFGGELYFGEKSPYFIPEGEYRAEWDSVSREIESLDEGWSITAVLNSGVPWSDAEEDDVEISSEDDDGKYEGVEWQVFREMWQDIRKSGNPEIENYYHN